MLLLCGNVGSGQTCCSGGIPLSSSLGLPPEMGKTLQFNHNYDLNVLQTLKTGTSKLDDDRPYPAYSFRADTGGVQFHGAVRR